MNRPVTHSMPDHPVLNLEVAQHALAQHTQCGEECEAKRYFSRQVPYLERSGYRERGATSWNIWAGE